MSGGGLSMAKHGWQSSAGRRHNCCIVPICYACWPVPSCSTKPLATHLSRQYTSSAGVGYSIWVLRPRLQTPLMMNRGIFLCKGSQPILIKQVLMRFSTHDQTVSILLSTRVCHAQHKPSGITCLDTNKCSVSGVCIICWSTSHLVASVSYI